MMFRQDQAQLRAVTIYGRQWDIRLGSTVHIAPALDAEPLPTAYDFYRETALARQWFLANQGQFDLEGLS